MKQKQIAANSPILNPKFTLSTLLLLSSKLTLISNTITTSLVFLLPVKKLSNNNDKNMKLKNTQKHEQEEYTLELATYILVLCAEPPRI